MQTLPQNLTNVKQLINKYAVQYGRDPASITLLAVSKTKPVSDIEAVAAAGQINFGENYLQEALGKIHQLPNTNLLWHFIGSIQSNKTSDIAAHFDWVHSVDRLKIARRLSAQRPTDLKPLNICLEVNLDAETSKGGFDLSEDSDAQRQALLTACQEIAALPQCHLRGLMAIPAPRQSLADQRAVLARLRHALEHLNQQGCALDTLSMGMSADLEAAIAEGATIVRIGTAIFGAREA